MGKKKTVWQGSRLEAQEKLARELLAQGKELTPSEFVGCANTLLALLAQLGVERAVVLEQALTKQRLRLRALEMRLLLSLHAWLQVANDTGRVHELPDLVAAVTAALPTASFNGPVPATFIDECWRAGVDRNVVRYLGAKELEYIERFSRYVPDQRTKRREFIVPVLSPLLSALVRSRIEWRRLASQEDFLWERWIRDYCFRLVLLGGYLERELTWLGTWELLEFGVMEIPARYQAELRYVIAVFHCRVIKNRSLQYHGA